MKTAIIYASKHGTTETVAQMISSKLPPAEVSIFRISEAFKLDLNGYDRIILGSSIHAGKNQSTMRKFCKMNTAILLQKQTALFLCCMLEKEAENSMKQAYPEILRQRSLSVKVFGGEYRVEKMNFFEKFLLKKIAGVTTSGSFLKHEVIDQFVLDVVGNENSDFLSQE